MKTHITTGVKTNVVTAVEIHEPNAHDGNQLPSMLKTTAENFEVSELCADMAYSSQANLQAVVDVGGAPLIPFKKRSTHAKGGVWSKMLGYYQYQREEFLERYHQRSNVESTFSMIKAKFGDSVRAKGDLAMKNEVLAKLLCHNVCCVVQSMYEFGIEPLFLGTRKK